MENPLDGDFFLGSADWMYRNLHARVEAITPIYDKTAKEKLWDILQSYWHDQAQSWTMKSDGSYHKKLVTDHKHMVGVQAEMMAKALQKITLTEDDLVKDED
jgi:polyphosphate kinase